MLKIGVFGVGHLGRIHLKCLLGLPQMYELVGFYDTNIEAGRKISQETGVPFFENRELLLQAADIIDIVTPTTTHFELAQECMRAGKHIFVEKPITQTVSQGLELCRLADERGVQAQVGHVERFNPAFLALDGYKLDPKFIEVHRLAMFNPRGTDVSVVEDLMIHDLDIMLALVDSPVYKVSANGVAIVSKHADIANARIEFDNGAVANITASRISLKQMRKFRLFQPDAYISMDFLNKQTELVRLHDQAPANAVNFTELDTAIGRKYLEISMPQTEATNAIQMELQLFGQAILQNTPPKVPLQAGLAALELAHWILETINK
jgi:predicted dehydrogenase